MTEQQAMMKMPRTRHRVMAELRSAEQQRDAIMKLVADLAAMDIRPLLWSESTGVIPERDLDIPMNIREAYSEAFADVRRLQHELCAITVPSSAR